MNPLIAALQLLPPEAAHRATLALLKAGLGPNARDVPEPALGNAIWGRKFFNPLGIAAGFDKNAEAVIPLAKMGFGFVEAGTVTPRPQPGNPSPRLFRWRDRQAVINRLGFNNGGLDAYVQNLRNIEGHPLRRQIIIGGNVGRNKDSTDAVADYVEGIKRVTPHVEYVVINISSPNTPGLRGLQNRNELTALLNAVQDIRAKLNEKPPLLVKIAPDLDKEACAVIAEVTMAAAVDGLIISNTTVARPPDMPEKLAAEAGGLSGPPLRSRANDILKTMAILTRKQMPLIGVGGISNAMDAYAKIRLGASLVQLYTGLIYQGPGLVREIKQGLVQLLRRDRFTTIGQAIGVDIKIND